MTKTRYNYLFHAKKTILLIIQNECINSVPNGTGGLLLQLLTVGAAPAVSDNSGDV